MLKQTCSFQVCVTFLLPPGVKGLSSVLFLFTNFILIFELKYQEGFLRIINKY